MLSPFPYLSLVHNIISLNLFHAAYEVSCLKSLVHLVRIYLKVSLNKIQHGKWTFCKTKLRYFLPCDCQNFENLTFYIFHTVLSCHETDRNNKTNIKLLMICTTWKIDYKLSRNPTNRICMHAYVHKINTTQTWKLWELSHKKQLHS
jgi:hypothetical protein